MFGPLLYLLHYLSSGFCAAGVGVTVIMTILKARSRDGLGVLEQQLRLFRQCNITPDYFKLYYNQLSPSTKLDERLLYAEG
jgi:hypothetical protein